MPIPFFGPMPGLIVTEHTPPAVISNAESLGIPSFPQGATCLASRAPRLWAVFLLLSLRAWVHTPPIQALLNVMPVVPKVIEQVPFC